MMKVGALLVVGATAAATAGLVAPNIENTAPLSDLEVQAQGDACLAQVNQYRATKGKPALTLNSGKMSCATSDAQQDGPNFPSSAHGSFGKCGEGGQCEAAGTPTCAGAMTMYFNEGPGGGHYEIIMSSNYKSMSYGYCACSSSYKHMWTHNFYRTGESLAEAESDDVEVTQSLGAYIANYARSVEGQRIDRGECWDLANEAIIHAKAAGFKVAASPSTYRWSSQTVNYQNAQPGDILQFVNYHEKTQHGGRSTGPHHTAVVTKSFDSSSGGIEVEQQNPKPVSKAVYHPGSKTGGSMTVYRMSSSMMDEAVAEELPPAANVTVQHDCKKACDCSCLPAGFRHPSRAADGSCGCKQTRKADTLTQPCCGKSDILV